MPGRDPPREAGHDPRHLGLAGTAVPADRLLDRHRVVFGHGEVVLGRRKERYTAGLTQPKGALRGPMTEDGLDGHTVRAAHGQLRVQALGIVLRRRNRVTLLVRMTPAVSSRKRPP